MRIRLAINDTVAIIIKKTFGYETELGIITIISKTSILLRLESNAPMIVSQHIAANK